MPAAQLVLSAVESAANRLLALDPNTQARISKLSAKQLAIKLLELDETVVMAFSERIDLLKPDSEQVAWDCKITLSIWSIKELQDPSRITQLIKQDKLDVEGDIQLAQDFSALIKQLDIDWEEHLSRYFGDVFAHQAVKTAKRAHQSALANIHKVMKVVSEGALEEKKVAAPGIAVAHFAEQVHQTRADVERLQSRIDLIQARLKA